MAETTKKVKAPYATPCTVTTTLLVSFLVFRRKGLQMPSLGSSYTSWSQPCCVAHITESL